MLSDFPAIASRLVDADPDRLSPHSTVKVWWRCVNDPAHTFDATPHSVVPSVAAGYRSAGCRYCKKSKSAGLPVGVREVRPGRFQARVSRNGVERTRVFNSAQEAAEWRITA